MNLQLPKNSRTDTHTPRKGRVMSTQLTEFDCKLAILAINAHRAGAMPAYTQFKLGAEVWPSCLVARSMVDKINDLCHSHRILDGGALLFRRGQVNLSFYLVTPDRTVWISDEVMAQCAPERAEQIRSAIAHR